ncbi:MAG: AAC(3) family N-acetyltransferase [Chloroflexi bacterium]|nr:AAC(3) family N-acetyltransferase [Chloroflexota bacterium]
MIGIREALAGFESLPIRGQAVIAHGSFKSLGRVQGGPRVVVDALARSCDALIMPTFTYDTMVTPLVGPPNNALDYAAEEHTRQRQDGVSALDAIPFKRAMPADVEMGVLPETLRRRPDATRSLHPILSFAGVNAEFALQRQTMYDPLAPIGALAAKNGWIVLIGVDHTVNTSIHYAEKLAGRKQFTRWARLRKRIVECPNFPGDSSGFNEIASYLDNDVVTVTIGEARVQALPLNSLIDRVKILLRTNPLALLCQRNECMRCNEVRKAVRALPHPDLLPKGEG